MLGGTTRTQTTARPAHPDPDPRSTLVALSEADPYALFALREHAKDAGYPLDPSVLRTLRAHGLATERGVSPEIRRLVAEAVVGAGVALDVVERGRGPREAPAPKLAATGRGAGPAGARFGLDAPFAKEVAGSTRRGDGAKAAGLLLDKAKRLAASAGPVGVSSAVRWCAAAATLVDENGRARPELERLLQAVEAPFAKKLSKRAMLAFYDLAASTGTKLKTAPELPLRKVPYWQKETHPLLGFQSSPKLPEAADIVIVGAGMTGGSAALHLADEAKKRGLSVVMLDAGEVASQASGRNGGNLEAIPENFFGAYGTYDGYVEERYKFLKDSYPDLPEAALRAQAQRIAETIIKFGYKNAKLVTEDIAREGLEVDHSLAGWLRLALNEREEKALLGEVELGQKLGLGIRAISPEEIGKKYKIDTKLHGRIVEDNGNFHPFKMVVQEVERAIDRGVKLYTNTKVAKVDSRKADEHVLETSRGTITAKKVIVAANAFTSEIFPALGDIQYFRSQIVNYAHVQNDLGGITFTAKDGDIYGNFPKQDWSTDADGTKRGTLHLGGGQDTRAEGPANAKPTKKVYKLIQHEAKEIFPDLEGRVPLRTWAGPMAFVEGKHGMRMPVISELGDGAEKGVLVAVWCNGYGSTGCQKTGAEAARWALTGALSDDVPADVFGVKRLLSDEPMFDPVRGGPRAATKG